MTNKIYDHKEDWFYEGSIGSQYVEHLKQHRYKIKKNNSANFYLNFHIDVIDETGNIERLL